MSISLQSACDFARTRSACLLDSQFPEKNPFWPGKNFHQRFSILTFCG